VVSEAPAASVDVYEFKVGELSAVALKAGGFNLPNDANTIGVGRAPEEIASLLSGAGVSTTELSLSIQPLLVKADDKVLLFDTGLANNDKLATSMQEAGIEPASITDVFISHAHGDHIGGLLDASNALMFANATIHMSEAEAAFIKGMDETAAAGLGAGRHAALISVAIPKVQTFAPDSEIIPGLVKAVDIKGHTPGHSGYLITSGSESLLYIGDTAHHHVVSVQQPEWTIRFDGDAPTAQASRKSLIEQNAAAGQRIYAVHFPFPGIGKFTKTGERAVWTPEE